MTEQEHPMPEKTPTPEPLRCSVKDCDRPVAIVTPLPLCREDALTVWNEVLQLEITLSGDE